jgi:hypothetical protein
LHQRTSDPFSRVIYSVDIESRKVFVESIGSRGDGYK